MEWPKLKNIIIILLACVNLFLLVLALHREHESQGYSESAREDAITVLWNACRIELDRDLLPEDMTLPVMVVERDPELERQQAAVLLGELSDDGGDAMRYEGALGTAQFYINGAFSAEFHPGAYPVGEETPEDFSLALMERLDIEAQVVSADTGGWPGRAVVVVQQSWAGTPIFACTATLVFWDGELREIQRDVSRRLPGVPQPLSDARCLDMVTLLLDFADYVKQNSRVCSAITGFTAGYTLDAQSEPTQLIPTWRVTTDNGAYYWNAVTGEIRPEQAES